MSCGFRFSETSLRLQALLFWCCSNVWTTLHTAHPDSVLLRSIILLQYFVQKSVFRVHLWFMIHVNFMTFAHSLPIVLSSRFPVVQIANEFYARFTGQSVETMEMETNRENFLSPQQAIELGLIDGVV